MRYRAHWGKQGKQRGGIGRGVELEILKLREDAIEGDIMTGNGTGEVKSVVVILVYMLP